MYHGAVYTKHNAIQRKLLNSITLDNVLTLVMVVMVMVLLVLIYLHIAPLSFQQLSHYKFFPLSGFSFLLVEFFYLFEVGHPVLDSRLQGWVRVTILV